MSLGKKTCCKLQASCVSKLTNQTIGHFLKEAAMNKAQVVSCTWTACQVSFKRVFHATVLEAVLGPASSCWKWCCAWWKSWIARKYPCFIFNIPVRQREFQKKKHVAPWRPVLHLPSLLPGTNKPSHKSDSINGSDPLCIWLASWWTTYYQSSMAQALPLKSDVSSGHSCKQPPRPRWAWPMHSLEASELDPTDGKCQTGLYIRCSPLNMEWSSRKQPPSETGKLCIEQKQFRVSLYKHEAASTWKKIQSKFLGDHIVESYLPLYLLVWGSRPIGSSLQQHTVFFDSGLVSRNNASAKSQAYRINETWKKYNKYKQKNKTLLTLHITIRF